MKIQLEDGEFVVQKILTYEDSECRKTLFRYPDGEYGIKMPPSMTAGKYGIRCCSQEAAQRIIKGYGN